MIDFFINAADTNTVWILILLTGLVTYITRFSGHIVLARFKNLHPRVEAALEAVPAAALVTIILPPLLNNGALEIVAMIAAFIVSFRFSILNVLAVGMMVVIGGRYFGF